MMTVAARAGSPACVPWALVVLDTTPSGGRGIICDGGARLHQRAAREVGPERAGLDDDHSDAERFDFRAQPCRQPFEGAFRGRIIARARRGAAGADRGNIDDGPATPRPHSRQHRLDQRHRPEEVGGEKFIDVRFVGLLHGGAIAVAGIVDEHVHRAELRLSPPHRLGDLRAVGDVQRKCERGIGIAGNEALYFPRIAGGHHRVPAMVQYGRSEITAKAARASGNQPGRHRRTPEGFQYFRRDRGGARLLASRYEGAKLGSSSVSQDWSRDRGHWHSSSPVTVCRGDEPLI